MSIAGRELAQRVQEYLNSQNWKYSIISNAFRLGFNLKNQLEECSMSIQIRSYGDGAFGVHTSTTCPLIVPAERKNKVLEWITRANYGMVDGYFSYLPSESNSEEGTIEYNTWLYCNDVIPSLNDVESSVDFPLQMMIKYGDALFNVIQLGANPEEEIRRVEG